MFYCTGNNLHDCESTSRVLTVTTRIPRQAECVTGKNRHIEVDIFTANFSPNKGLKILPLFPLMLHIQALAHETAMA